MADYRQSCSTAGCGYTGFSGHSDFCPQSGRYSHYLEEQKRIERLEKDGFKTLTLARSSSFMPGTQDVELLWCTYCGCTVADKDIHRKNACP
jgi:hypothetical protein